MLDEIRFVENEGPGQYFVKSFSLSFELKRLNVCRLTFSLGLAQMKVIGYSRNMGIFVK